MRRTRKRGGKSDQGLEMKQVIQLANEANSLEGPNRAAKYKELFELVLNSTHLIRTRRIRGVLNTIIDNVIRSNYGDEELDILVNDVRHRMLDIPEEDLVAGKRVKRKTRKSRKNYRK